MNEDAVLNLLMELKNQYGDVKSKLDVVVSDMENLKKDIAELKEGFRDLQETKQNQTIMQSEIKTVMNCCDELKKIELMLTQQQMNFSALEKRIEVLEKSKEIASNRIWSVILFIVNNLLLWGTIGIIAFKLKVL